MNKKILIACEYSQAVTEQFHRVNDLFNLGFEILSCDLLPAEKGFPHHVGDVLDLMKGSDR